MKKIVFIIILIVLFIIIIPSNETSDEVRLRVIAASDSSYDKSVKNEVVTILKEVINPSDTLEMVKAKKGRLYDEINDYLYPLGISFTLEIKDSNFPVKELNNKVIPGGVYKTVLVTIGKGKGNNWWSLLYPEYFGVTFEDIKSENVEIKFYFYEEFLKKFNIKND